LAGERTGTDQVFSAYIRMKARGALLPDIPEASKRAKRLQPGHSRRHGGGCKCAKMINRDLKKLSAKARTKVEATQAPAVLATEVKALLENDRRLAWDDVVGRVL
jgi:hypothetical protein